MKKFTQTNTDLYQVNMEDIIVVLKMTPGSDIELDTPTDQYNDGEYCLWYFNVFLGERRVIRCIPYSTIAHFANT